MSCDAIRAVRHEFQMSNPVATLLLELQDCTVNEKLQLDCGERLRQVVPGAHLQRSHVRIQVGVPGHDYDYRVALPGEYRPKHLDSRHSGHAKISQDNLEPAARHHLQRHISTFSHGNVPSSSTQRKCTALAHASVIIDNQDSNRSAIVCVFEFRAASDVTARESLAVHWKIPALLTKVTTVLRLPCRRTGYARNVRSRAVRQSRSM